MTITYSIYLQNYVHSKYVEKNIEDRIANFNRIVKTINSCRITIESHYDKEQSKSLYIVKINLTVDGNIIITNRCPNSKFEYEDINVAIWRAFSELQQQLDNYSKSKLQTGNNNVIPYGSKIKLIFKT